MPKLEIVPDEEMLRLAISANAFKGALEGVVKVCRKALDDGVCNNPTVVKCLLSGMIDRIEKLTAPKTGE